MKKLRLLIGVKWKGLVQSTFSRGVNGKKPSLGKKILFALLTVYLIGVIAVLFGGLTALLVGAMQPLGMEWLALAIAAIASIMLCFITMIFTMQSQIFNSKDNDMLLSMPIKPAVIVSSRVLSLLLLEYVYNAVVLVPTMVVYASMVQPPFYFYPLFIIGALLLPLIPLALAGFVAYLLTAVSSKVKFKNLIMTVLFVAVFGVYMYACFNLQKYMMVLVQNGEQIADAIRHAVPPIYHFANMAATGSIWSTLIVVLWCAIPMGLLLLLLSKTLTKYSNQSTAVQVAYKKKPMNISRPWVAIFKKEVMRLGTSTTYMFNTAFMVVLVFAGSVYLAIKGPSVLGELATIPGFASVIVPLAMAMLCFVAGISCTTAPSISLEGKSFWVLRSSPIAPTDVFKGKIALNLLITLPAMAASVLICTPSFGFTALDVVGLIAVPCALSLFVAMLGLYVNLLFPRLDYPSDAHAVKQGIPVMIMSFGGMGIVLLPAVLYVIVLAKYITFNVFAICLFVFLALVCFALWQILKRDGVRRFENI